MEEVAAMAISSDRKDRSPVPSARHDYLLEVFRSSHRSAIDGPAIQAFVAAIPALAGHEDHVLARAIPISIDPNTIRTEAVRIAIENAAEERAARRIVSSRPVSGKRTAESPAVTWERSDDTELARMVRAIEAKHLETYRDPSRIREDYRNEASILEAAYRKRQLVELIQNGADALRATPGGGRIEVVLTDHQLLVANEGDPLNADGLEALLYLGLSPKTSKEIGRLGVGFKSVLEIATAPRFLSRSVSVAFDPVRARRILESHVGPVEGQIATMRIADVIDPFKLARDDAVLAELMTWATSIVQLPLDKGASWVPEMFDPESLRQEFLLFSPHVREVVLHDRQKDQKRTIACARSGDTLTLTEGGESPGEWQVRSITVSLSDDAIADGGDLFGREEVDLAWAIPMSSDEAGKHREMWAFFPVPGVSTSLPGILNSAWKLSADRGNLVPGPLNEQLLAAAAGLVVTHLTDHAPTDRPGFVLELLPPPPSVETNTWGSRAADGAGWAGPVLQKHVWRLAPDAEIVPSIAGDWRKARQLKLWPEWINKSGMKDLADRWQSAVVEPTAWVHRSVMTDNRLPRARRLGAHDADVVAWLAALRDERDQSRSGALALGLARALLDLEAASEDHERILDAPIVFTENGSWCSIAESRVDDEAPAHLSPARGSRGLVRDLHKRAGISSDMGERTLLDLALNGLAGTTPLQFWEAVHSVGSDRAAGVLEQVASLSVVPVRTVSGEFRSPRSILAPGPILTSESDPELCLDTDFHAEDARLLERMGVRETPAMVELPQAQWLPLVADYRRSVERQWQQQQIDERGGYGPQDGTASVTADSGPSSCPSHLDVFRAACTETRRRFTSFLMDDDHWASRWTVRHSTQYRKYSTMPCSSPAAWAVRKFGVVDTSRGLMPVDRAVGPNLQRWAHFLPVASISEAAASAIRLPSGLDHVDPGFRDTALTLCSAAADTAETGECVEFFAAAAAAGWRPRPALWDPAPLVDSLNEVKGLRASEERVWFCAPARLVGWPDGWSFPGVERPPAESVGDVDAVSLSEYFPALANHVGEGKVVLLLECDRVLVGGRSVPFGRRGDSLLIDRTANRDEVLRWMLREVLPEASDHVHEGLLAEDVTASLAELVASVRAAEDDDERLHRLLRDEGLRVAVEQLLPWDPPSDGLSRAQALLTLYGPSALKETHHLLPDGLGTPRHWAGGQRTLEFVRKLGFPDSFAGRRRAERPDEERVLGPTVAGELHPFQAEIAERVQDILTSRSRGIVDLPTGAGKTRVAIESILDHADAVGRLGTVLWLAEREELCEQAVTQWTQLWRARGLRDRELHVLRFWGGRWPKRPDDGEDCVVVASRQQLHGRLGNEAAQWLTDCGLLLIDEAHHTTARTYLDIVKWRANTNPEPFTTLGLSATPFRSDVERSAHLSRLFDKSLVTGDLMGARWKDRIKWLQKEQYLSKVERTDLGRGLVSPTDDEATVLSSDPNLSTGLDLVNQRLGQDPGRNLQIVDTITAMDPSWPIVVFAGSVAHAQRLAAMLTDQGIAARPVWGQLAQWARRDAIEQFREGGVRVLTNFNVLSEGFDAPQTRAVIIARLVQSDGLFLQMLGRGMRGPKNGGTKKCMLVTTGERLPERFDRDGQLDVERHEFLWSTK
jgi:superfamily II DNA or RNA helicase